ncbi:MAG: hypothetical protein P8169_04045 [Chloroflexota bacterium]
MSFPSIFDWLETFSFLRGYPSVWLLLATGTLITLFLDWRLSLFALIVQYLVATLLYFDLLNPQLALIKLFVGMFVCLILYWTARQVDYGRSHGSPGRSYPVKTGRKIQVGPLSMPRNLAERAAAAVIALLLVVILQWGFSLYLPGLPEGMDYINLAILLLITLGMAGVITSRDPLSSGMSVLTFLTGFELYFAAIDQTTRTLGLLAVLNFVVALVVSYLTQRGHARTATALSHD